MKHFSGKYEQIKRHLAVSYVKANRGIILETRKSQSTKRTVIKQETKGIKSEVKSEIKHESAASNEEIDPLEFEQRFEV